MSGESLRFLRRPGGWLWLAVAVGAGLRLALLLFTEGSFDVAIKLHHGNQIGRLGLLEWYRQAEVMNHPPLAGEFFAGAVALSRVSGIPFPFLLRAPFALLDLGTALLLLRLFRADPWRYAIFAAYWLNPLAILMSAYHGNTDSALAFFALLATLCVGAGRPLAAGAVLGVGLWIKLPILVAAPPLFFAFPVWRERGRFALAAAAVAVAGLLPWLLAEPALLLRRILFYPGSDVVTPSGVAVWGIAHTLRLTGSAAAETLATFNTPVCWIPILALAWLRRGAWSAREAGASVCGCFLLLYGMTSFWAWQYLAWAIPFWFCLGWRFVALATVLLGGYVYGAYTIFTGSPWLLGRFDFVNHARWPAALTLLRDASVVLCLATGWWMLQRSARAEWQRRRRERA